MQGVDPEFNIEVFQSETKDLESMLALMETQLETQLELVTQLKRARESGDDSVGESMMKFATRVHQQYILYAVSVFYIHRQVLSFAIKRIRVDQPSVNSVIDAITQSATKAITNSTQTLVDDCPIFQIPLLCVSEYVLMIQGFAEQHLQANVASGGKVLVDDKRLVISSIKLNCLIESINKKLGELNN